MDRPAGGVPRYRDWKGLALLSAGFRPFFLLAGIWAGLALPLWLVALTGRVSVPSLFDPATWHAHAMLFGFVQAAVAGFLLTAVPNWTGRMPLQGRSLGALALVFVAGRAAVSLSALTGAGVAALVDLAFPLLLIAALAREIVAGRNWRNLPMPGALALFATGNSLTHVEALGWAETGALGLRLGIAVPALLISLIGGRIVPSFTRNWLVKRGSAALPAPADATDRAATALLALALGVWVAAPEWPGTAFLLALAAAATLWRLWRWRGGRTAAEPLVWVLHLGFAWVPVGLALLALVPVLGLPQTAAVHALTGGAMTTMILAVTTRATLGHTGRGLSAGTATLAVYLLVTAAAVLRVAAALWPTATMPLLILSGVAWTAAFLLFLAVYGPMLLGPRAGRRSGSSAP